MSIELYPHNQETYNKIIEHWKINNKVAAVQATGTGKSFLILKCIEDFVGQKKIILAPSHYIFNQLITHNNDIEPENTEFITYAKISMMDEEEIKELNPKLIVLDEFHRCGAKEWGRGVQMLLNIYPNTKLLGTSATPIRFLDNERNMSDELFDGNVVVNLSLAEAIVRKILPTPKYISALYTLDDEVVSLKNKVNNSANDIEEKNKILKKIDSIKNKLDKSKGVPIILGKYLDKNNGKYIVFCKNQQHLNKMKPIVINWFKKATGKQNINTYTVCDNYCNSEIEFKAFKNTNNINELHILFSIEMLNEGVHIDDIDGVLLLRPTISPIVYYQQIGRAIDAGRDNKPLIFDFVNNFENISASKLGEELKEVKERLEYSNDITYIIDDIYNFIIYDEIQDIKILFENIENELVGSWDIRYNELLTFYNENGHSNVPSIYESNKKLGIWVGTQRECKKRKKLDISRIEALNKINFCWDVIDNGWMEKYHEVKKYFYENSTNKIPKTNTALNRWTNNQRKDYKNNKLSENKIKLLIGINFHFNVNIDNWNVKYNILFESYLENKKFYVPKKENKSLASWICQQRYFYRNNKLENWKINKLNDIDFNWDGKSCQNKRYQEQWNTIYLLVCEYIKLFGVLKTTTIYKNIKLGNWLIEQKTQYKNNNLSDYRIQKLIKIGIDLNVINY